VALVGKFGRGMRELIPARPVRRSAATAGVPSSP
jgi:hypothetical protein